MSSTFLVTSSDEFENAARADLRRYDPKLQPGENLAPGLFLINTQMDETDFAAIAAQEPPIYARHFFPVQATIPLTQTLDDLDKLAEAVKLLSRLAELDSQTPFA